jgi:hypothetical protein
LSKIITTELGRNRSLFVLARFAPREDDRAEVVTVMIALCATTIAAIACV